MQFVQGHRASQGGAETQTVTEHKFVCPMHHEAKQYQNIRIWSRERFIAGSCKEMAASCPPKTLNSLKAFSKAFLKAR